MVLGVRGIPNVQGGVETHAEQLYTRLAKLGLRVEVLTRSPFVPRGQHFLGGIRLRRLWAPRMTGLEALIHSVLGVLYAGILRPDILHIHAVGPAIVTPFARLLGLRVVVTHHGPDYERDKWGPFARWVLRRGERWGMRCSNDRIAISQVICDLIRSKYDRDSELIPNGVAAVKPLHGRKHLERLFLEPGRYFLQVSRIVPEKRQLDLIKAYSLARPHDWKLVLVGGADDSAYSREVQEAAAIHGVVMTGFQSGDALAEIYSGAGAFVLPSSHEGLPIAMLEALSYGLPVIASDIAANIEVGLDSASYFALGDAEALAMRLVHIASSPDDAYAREGRRNWVKSRYDWDEIARRTIDVYRRVQRS